MLWVLEDLRFWCGWIGVADIGDGRIAKMAELRIPIALGSN